MAQRLIPGVGWIDEQDTAQRLIPGVGWVDEQAGGAGAPPAGTVTITSVTPGSTTASVVYSYDAADQTGFEYRLDGGTPAAIGASPATITGLTDSTPYDLEVRAVNGSGDGAWSAVESFTTTTPDTTAPTVTDVGAVVKSNALAVILATTNDGTGTMRVVTTTSATPPSKAQVKAGQDHTGAAAVFADSQAIGSTGIKTFNATGHTALQTYYGYVVHTDAADTPNDSDVEATGAFVMFRDGALAQDVIDNTAAVGGNPAGHMYALALTLDPDVWMAYRTISGPTPSGGTLTEYVNGNFEYFGPDAAIWTTQAELDGVDHTEQTIITLYDQTVRVETSQSGAWSVRNLVAATQAGAWSVRNLAAATQAGAWSVRNLVSASQDGAWSVSNVTLATATQDGAWSVRNYVEVSQSGAWSVDGIVYTSAPSGGGFNPFGNNKIRPARFPGKN